MQSANPCSNTPTPNENAQRYSATSGLGSILDSATYTHLGQLAQTLATTSGTQIAHTYTYEPASGRLSTDYTNSPSSGGVLSNDTYTYDSAGDILEDNNVVTGVATDTQCYSYDPLQDLTAAWTPSSNVCTGAPSSSALGGPAPYWTSYTINPANGDRTQDIRHATTGTGLDTRDTYTYPTSGYLAGGVGGPTAQSGVQHATAAAGTNPVTGTWTVTGADAYAYNGNGSTTSRPGQSIIYDAEGHQQQVTVTAGTTQNDVYDANGTLLLQTESSGGTGTTAFLGDTELHVASGSSTVTATRTYTAAGQVLAERDTTSGVTGSQYYYLDTNTTATATASLAVTGATITRRYTDPYGNTRGTTTTWTSTHGFLNAPTSSLTGLTHLGARQYDPSIGRFTTVDPLLSAGNPRSVNGYSYADNNPTTQSDPSGRSTACDAEPAACAADGGPATFGGGPTLVSAPAPAKKKNTGTTPSPPPGSVQVSVTPTTNIGSCCQPKRLGCTDANTNFIKTATCGTATPDASCGIAYWYANQTNHQVLTANTNGGTPVFLGCQNGYSAVIGSGCELNRSDDSGADALLSLGVIAAVVTLGVCLPECLSGPAASIATADESATAIAGVAAQGIGQTVSITGVAVSSLPSFLATAGDIIQSLGEDPEMIRAVWLRLVQLFTSSKS